MKKFMKDYGYLVFTVVFLVIFVTVALGIQWYLAKEWAEVLNVPFDFKFYLLYLFRK